MNSPTSNTLNSNSATRIGDAEQTLRILATLPAPDCLEQRLMEALRQVPPPSGVLPWPSEKKSRRGWMNSNLVRGAAAAAIVFVVGGGSWGVYSRVHPAQVPKVLVPRVAAPGGFSSAGAMRTPQTLNGPVLAHPVNPLAKDAHIQTHSAKKPRKAAKTAEPAKTTQ
jgi:hypothetical protein